MLLMGIGAGNDFLLDLVTENWQENPRHSQPFSKDLAGYQVEIK